MSGIDLPFMVILLSIVLKSFDEWGTSLLIDPEFAQRRTNRLYPVFYTDLRRYGELYAQFFRLFPTSHTRSKLFNADVMRSYVLTPLIRLLFKDSCVVLKPYFAVLVTPDYADTHSYNLK